MARLALDHKGLRQFLAVAEVGSVRGGASALNISQPPLTQAIKRLENELGVALFERRPKGMALTPAGQVLAEEARDILARLERAETRTLRALHADPIIRIGFVSAALGGTLQRLLERLAGRAVDLTEMTTPQQEAALMEGRIDIALLHPPIATEDINLQRLGRDPFVAALPARHPLSASGELAFRQIAGEPFILFPREQGPSLMGVIERLTYEAGQGLNVVATAPRVHSQLAIIAGGLGVGLVTRSTAASIRFEGVCFVKIVDTEDRLFLELAAAGEPSLVSLLAAGGSRHGAVTGD